MLSILARVEDVAKGIPPVDNKASRFGNPAFRTFYDKVSEVSYYNVITCFVAQTPYSSHQNFMQAFLTCPQTQSQRYLHTSVSRGETELA